MAMFKRPSADVTSVEKTASQKRASNVRPCERLSMKSKGTDTCQEDQFRRACRLVRRRLSYLQVRLQGLRSGRGGLQYSEEK